MTLKQMQQHGTFGKCLRKRHHLARICADITWQTSAQISTYYLTIIHTDVTFIKISIERRQPYAIKEE